MTCGMTAGQPLNVNYSPRYTHCRKCRYVDPYYEQSVGRERSGSAAELALGSEDEQHTFCSAQRKKRTQGYRCRKQPEVVGQWILPFDNADHLVQDWLERHYIGMMVLPPYSPDLALMMSIFIRFFDI